MLDSKLIYPLLFLIWGGVAIFFISSLVITWDRYEENLCLRKSIKEKDLHFYEELCKDGNNKDYFGIVEECIKREHALHKTAEMYAIIDTLDGIGLCYNTKCEDLLGQGGFLIPLVLIIPCVIVIIFLLCGCELFRYGLKENTNKMNNFEYKKIE